MFTPQIKNLASFGRRNEGEIVVDAPSRRKLDELCETLDHFEADGDDHLLPMFYSAWT